MKFKQIICKLTLLASALSFTTGIVTASAPVLMKVLVLSMSPDDEGYHSIATLLDQVGVPYETVFVGNLVADSSGNRLSSLALSDSTTGNGLYQGIIQTDGSFSVCTNGACQSLLSPTDWSKLNTYASEFSVRVVAYYTYPDPKWGLLAADSGASYTTANPLNVTLTSAGAAIFSYLNAANSIPISGPTSAGLWAYRATPTAASGETTTPLLAVGAYTVAAVHTTSDSRETLALTMDNYPGLLHSTAFGYGLINWVTKGVFLGSRKVYLNPQIDDMLLGNRLYAPTLPQCPADASCPTIYASGPDLQALTNWQNNLKADPLFSSFHSTFAFNGVGTTWFAPDNPIFSSISSLGSNFTWLIHTWDHANLDCYTTDSNGNCVPATVAQSQVELNQDISVAPSLGINLDRTSMVTPFNGGLSNANFLAAAVSSGLQYIVTAVPPSLTNTGYVNPLNSGIYEIPRITPNLFDDVSVPQTGAYGSWTGEYNAIFGPSGTRPIYSQNQTYSQILDNESNNLLLGTLLTYEPYLLAFHIDNSSTYDGTHSLFSDLIDATVTKYKRLFNLPVLTMDMKDLAPLLMERSSYDASGVVGVYTPGVSVVLTTSKAAKIPVTGACSKTSCGTYGGQIQDDVVMTAGSTVTLSLTSSEDVTLSLLSIDPASLTSGMSATGTVTLSGPAPAGGISVSLASSDPSAVVPASVMIAAGSATATFSVTTSSVAYPTSANITASLNGVSKTAPLTVTPYAGVSLSSVSLASPSIASGISSTGTVTLSAAAPRGGIAIELWTTGTVAFVPTEITIATGSTTGTFTVATNYTSTTLQDTITAFYNGVSKSISIAVTP